MLKGDFTALFKKIFGSLERAGFSEKSKTCVPLPVEESILS